MIGRKEATIKSKAPKKRGKEEERKKEARGSF